MASKQAFTVDAAVRHDMGKGASRRLRREGKVPGVLYGGGKEPLSIIVEHKQLSKSLENEGFYSHILTLKTGTETTRVILKDLQRHAFKPLILHVDFQRIRADEKLHMHVPLHFLNESIAPGVKEGGGVISHIVNDVEISCLPDKLPEFLEVDVSNLQLNEILHLSDIKLPEGVEIVALIHEDDKPVISIHPPRVEEEAVAEGEIAPEEVPASEQKGEAKETEKAEAGKKQ